MTPPGHRGRRPRPGRRAAAVAAALLLALGCSDREPRRFNHVLHLDPRLEDGGSSAVALASRATVVAAHAPARALAPEGPLALRDATLQRELPGDAVRLRREKGRDRTIGLELGSLDATVVDAIEVDLRLRDDGVARLLWRRGEDPDAPEHVASVPVRAGDGAQTVRFALARRPGWHERVHGVRIEPSWPNAALLDVGEVRLLRLGFVGGFEPLEGGEDGALAGDGGLVPLEREAVRAWPTDLGVPLHARVTVPDAALLTLQVAAPAGDDEGPSVVAFRVDVREGAGPWETVARTSVRRGDGWETLRADLDDRAGREVELRLAALAPGEEPEAGRAPERTRALFGAPRVLGRVPRPPRPSLVLITLDTLRADHVGDPDLTPRLNELAASGVRFDHAWSACNATTPSHASILTGLYVEEHGATSNREALAAEVTTLAERLRADGYETAAAVSVGHLEAGAGFGQGFDRFLLANRTSHLDGIETLEPTLAWLDEWGTEGPRPLFLWLHLFDPHTPYGPPEPFRDRFERLHPAPPATADPPTVPFVEGEPPGDLAWIPEDTTSHEHVRHLYRAGVAYTDHLIARLLDALEEEGLWAETAVCVTSDHGEALGEHRVYYGHAGLYPETLRVPLILRVPGGPRGVVVDAPVSTIDVAPTLLRLARLEPDPHLRGVDLLAVAREGGDPDRRLWFHFARAAQVGLHDPAAHFVTTTAKQVHYGLLPPEETGRPAWVPFRSEQGDAFLWDPGADPELERELSAQDPARVDALREEVRAWRESLGRRQALEREVSPEEEARLRALGYAGG